MILKKLLSRSMDNLFTEAINEGFRSKEKPPKRPGVFAIVRNRRLTSIKHTRNLSYGLRQIKNADDVVFWHGEILNKPLIRKALVMLIRVFNNIGDDDFPYKIIEKKA